MKYHPVVGKIKALIEEHDMWLAYFEHKPVITSEEAEAVRPDYSLAQGTKALIVRADIREKIKPHHLSSAGSGTAVTRKSQSDKRCGGKKFVMIVVSGDKNFDVKKVREILNAKDIRLAREEEVNEITGGVKVGGIPPFGNLFGLLVYADSGVFDNETIIFSAGDRAISIAMKPEDYKTLVVPTVCDIT